MRAEVVEAAISPELRQRLAAIAELVFPRTADMPGAGDVDLSGRLTDRVLHAVPSLAAGLRDALSAADGSPDAAVTRLRDHQPRLFKTLFLVMTSAYYLSPQVQDVVGYHGQQALKIDVHELPAYLEDGSLDRVVARGQLWIDAEE